MATPPTEETTQTMQSPVPSAPPTNGATAPLTGSTNGMQAPPVAPQAQPSQGSSPMLALPFFNLMRDFWDYYIDAAQRTVMFYDVLRQRGNQFFEHVAADQPPVLAFEYEKIMDGKDLPYPSNYYLLRIIPDKGQEIDPTKRPYVIIDPRAGHGPGIGGFKESSQIGVALGNGHPVYFVGFRPFPEPGQKLEYVTYTEAEFLREVKRRHPDAPKPVVIGNCQAGWAVAMLAAVEPDLMGPIIMNGAPLSYWGGKEGKDPMRYLGGLNGGSWAASYASDLGDGVFDGANLVANFENLNPTNTLWSKQYNVYANIDTEPKRYLEFEKWWNGFFLMTRDEMEFIVNNLFVSNKLEAAQLQLGDKTVSLRDITAPIVIFASHGDNITPPQQALNWLLDVYKSDQDILDDRQVIVYTVHKNIGHLGIFVSGKVAQREYASMFGTLDFIESLPPGLYEMIIEDKAPDAPPDEVTNLRYDIRFEERLLDDIRKMDDTREDEELFPAVSTISKLNKLNYKLFVSPFVRLMTTPQMAAFRRETHPNRLQHYIFSDRNPFMWPVALWAEAARTNRRPVDKSNPYWQLQEVYSGQITTFLNAYTNVRDTTMEVMFKSIYGPTGLGGILPEPFTTRKVEHDPEVQARIDAENARLIAKTEEGGFVEGFARIFMLLSRADRDVEPQAFIRSREATQNHPRLNGISYDELRQHFFEQFYILHLNFDPAVRALTKLLPAEQDRRDALELAKEIVLLGEPNADEQKVLAMLHEVLGLS